MDDWQQRAANWHYAHGKPQIEAVFRQQPEHFRVVEELGFTPEQADDSQHHWLYIRKRNLNTAQVVRSLARFAGVQQRDIGYSGLKDKFAITEQWFSVQLPLSATPDWYSADIEGVEILDARRSGKKLKRGVHRANRFIITLTDVENPDALTDRFNQVCQGVPNYFGEQRFGYQFRNLSQALDMFNGKRIRDRNLRSILLSAARSFVFNEVLSARWRQQQNLKPLVGDVFILSGSQSWFCSEEITTEISQRLNESDILFSGPMWGRGQPLSLLDALELESSITGAIADEYPKLMDGLEKAGLKQERRAAILVPEQPSITVQDDRAELAFSLPRGTFATSLLRELII